MDTVSLWRLSQLSFTSPANFITGSLFISSTCYRRAEFTHPGCHSLVLRCNCMLTVLESLKSWVFSLAIVFHWLYSSLRCKLTFSQLCARPPFILGNKDKYSKIKPTQGMNHNTYIYIYIWLIYSSDSKLCTSFSLFFCVFRQVKLKQNVLCSFRGSKIYMQW